MRGLLLLSDPHHAQMHPELWINEARKLNMQIHHDETAAFDGPPLLSALQTGFYRLRRRCEWNCVMAEGDMTGFALILAAQYPVDRLILLGSRAFFPKDGDRRLRRINAFARRNLSLITAEIFAVDMNETALRRLSSGLGFHSGGLLQIQDAAELWRKRETFLTTGFHSIQSQPEAGK